MHTKRTFTPREATALANADRAMVRVWDWIEEVQHEELDDEFRAQLREVALRICRLAEEAEA